MNPPLREKKIMMGKQEVFAHTRDQSQNVNKLSKQQLIDIKDTQWFCVWCNDDDGDAVYSKVEW